MQHITPNSKRWNYSDIPGDGHKKIKGLAHMVEGGHHLRKAPNPHPPETRGRYRCQNTNQDLDSISRSVVTSSYLHNGVSHTGKMAYLYWTNPLLIIRYRITFYKRGIGTQGIKLAKLFVSLSILKRPQIFGSRYNTVSYNTIFAYSISKAKIKPW